ncbi:MAG: calcium/sodium antiporter [Lachnospiraceae bacterium]
MNIWVALILFVIGIVLVVKGGDIFVDAASWIAKAAGIPTFIVGATIVSLATTMPELLVSSFAAAEGKIDMAIGNAVGSVIANTGLIMALSLIFLSISIVRKEYIKQCIMLVACATVLWVGSLSGHLAAWASIVLFFIFLGFMILNVYNAKQQSAAVERIEAGKKDYAKNIVLFLIGAAAIVVGSQFLVDGGSAIAEFLHVPERIIAVTLVAVGTSLPELVTTLTAIRKKESSLSIGNIIGANIIDLSMILPICSIVSGQGLAVEGKCLSVDMPACLIIIAIALLPLLIRQKSSKTHGIVVLASYAAYLFLTLA